MPRAKKLTEKKIDKILQGIIEGRDQDATLKGIKLRKEMIDEEKKKLQSKREAVTKRAVDDEKLQKAIGFSPYEPKRHEKQIEVLSSKADKIVIMAGKRGGKTALCAYFALRGLLEGYDVLVVAPSYILANRVLEYIDLWARRAFAKEIVVSFRPPQKVKTAWGAVLDCRSGEQPDQIMGKEYPVVIADECSKISETVHQRYIIPATGMKVGKRYYISTPFGRNWFWREWRKACEEGGGFQWKSLDNPYFDKKKWDEAKKELPDFIFKQEYEAEPQEEAMVFQGFNQCLNDYGFPQEYNPNHLYVAGIDVGKYESFTAISVIDRMTNQEVEHLRFKGDWAFQKERIISILDKYGKCLAWIDATSITSGDAYVDELNNEGYSAMGFKLGGIGKRQLIEKLIVKIQNRYAFFPTDEIGTDDSKEANVECRAYSYDLSPNGNIIYKAPQGEYEDCVIARALACWELDDELLPEMKKGEPEVIIPPKQEF